MGLDCSIRTPPGEILPSYMIVGTQKGGMGYQWKETPPSSFLKLEEEI